VPEATKRDDTISLVAAITQGKGLADMRPTAPQMHPMKPELAAPQHMMPRGKHQSKRIVKVGEILSGVLV